MTENMNLAIPIADRLCVAVQEAVQKLGGPDTFFDKLSENSSKFVDNFGKGEWQIRFLLRQCLAETSLRNHILSGISSASDREFLNKFLEGWEIWKQLEPQDHHWIMLVLAGAPIDDLLSSIPYRTNEVFRCTSALQIDSFYEDIFIKSAIQLSFPNKDLGGEGVLILSASVGSYIDSVRLILDSLLLGKRELRLFKIPKESRITTRILSELAELSEVVEKLKQQFEQMS